MKNNYVTHLINAKYHGTLPPKQEIVSFALTAPEFVHYWLCHAVSSSTSSQELAIVLCLAKYHKIEALKVLSHFWPIRTADPQVTINFEKHISGLPKTIQQGIETDLIGLWSSLIMPLNIQSSEQSLPVTTLETQLTNELAQEIIKLANNNLNLAGVYAENSTRQKVIDIRDNEQLITQLPVDNILIAILQRIICSDDYADLAYAEPMIIYRYTQGQQYKWHYDFITPSNENAKKELNFFGQRQRTRIINLNDGFEGGETAFKDWNVSVKAKQGQVIKFNNMIGNQVDKNSVHSGKPVLLGEKWICTLWMREKPFWLRESIWCKN